MKARTPRKSKKSIIKRGVLIYDLAVMPKGKTMSSVYNDFRTKGVVMYNSSAYGNSGDKNCNNIPFVINSIKNIKFVDLSQKSDEK